MKQLMIPFLIIVINVGCISTTKKDLSPQQRLYSLHAEYNMWMDKAVIVGEILLNDPVVSSDVKKKIKNWMLELLEGNGKVIVFFQITTHSISEVQEMMDRLGVYIQDTKLLYNNLISIQETKK